MRMQKLLTILQKTVLSLGRTVVFRFFTTEKLFHYFMREAMAEKYNLNWHTFSEHHRLMFKDLYEEGKH